jgi:transcriptional regulator with XRE-family HTH domain
MGGKSEADRLREGEAILADYNRGIRQSDLAEKYGLSQQTVSRRLYQAIHARLAPTVDQYREAQNALLDDLMGMLERQYAAAEEMLRQAEIKSDGVMFDKALAHYSKAIDAFYRHVERRARLNGLDAPVKAEVTMTVTTPFDTAVAGLVAQLDEAEKADAPEAG